MQLQIHLQTNPIKMYLIIQMSNFLIAKLQIQLQPKINATDYTQKGVNTCP